MGKTTQIYQTKSHQDDHLKDKYSISGDSQQSTWTTSILEGSSLSGLDQNWYTK